MSTETPRYDKLEPRHSEWSDSGRTWPVTTIDALLCDTLSALFDSETELARLLRATQSNLKGGDAIAEGLDGTSSNSKAADAVTGAAHPSPRGEPPARSSAAPAPEPVAWQLLEDLNLVQLERMAVEKEARGEQRIPCFISVEWVQRAVTAWRNAAPQPAQADEALTCSDAREERVGCYRAVRAENRADEARELLRESMNQHIYDEGPPDLIERIRAFLKDRT